MKIGSMNNPYKNIYKELKRISRQGFDFVDFTVECETMPHKLNVNKVKKSLKQNNLGIVGHIGDWRLPKISEYISLREASKNEMIEAMRILKKLGVKTVTFHQPQLKRVSYKDAYQRLSDLLKILLKEAKKLKITLIMENTDANSNEYRMLFEGMLRKFPKLGVHIDAGHANIGVNKNIAPYYIKKYRKRLFHMHFADNHGKDDEHIGLGEGNAPWKIIINTLKGNGYDGTITLEVFNKKSLLTSKKKLEKWWSRY